MYTEVCPSNPVEYLEDNFYHLIKEPDLENILGARLAVEYIAQDYEDSADLTEAFRSTSYLAAATKQIPVPWERATDQTWRAQALLAMTRHKVATRKGYSQETMAVDLRRSYAVSSPINYGYIRNGIMNRCQQDLRQKSSPSANEKLAVQVMGQVNDEYTLRPGTTIAFTQKLLRNTARNIRQIRNSIRQNS